MAAGGGCSRFREERQSDSLWLTSDEALDECGRESERSGESPGPWVFEF